MEVRSNCIASIREPLYITRQVLRWDFNPIAKPNYELRITNYELFNAFL